MTSEQSNLAGQAPSVFGRRGLPLFTAYMIWGTGSGAQTLARPLYAFSLSDSVLLVTLLISSLALSRMVSAPITGFLTDRWGRKPLAMAGAGIRGLTSLGVLFVNSYEAFFVLEFIGAVGVSMWQTTSSILIADLSTRENRGRAVALRATSNRLGMILGPFLAAAIAGLFGLRYAFAANAVAKGFVLLVVLFFIKETNPKESRKAAAAERNARPPAERGLGLAVFRSRAFLALAMTTFGVSLIGQGIFQTLFPIHARETAGLDAAQIGTLIGVAGVVTLFVSFPNGVLMDRFGRKRSLVPGLMLAATAAALLGLSTDHSGILQAALVFGVAQGMTMGATQTFAMDLAPEDRRGAFLGIWSMFQSFGAFVGPLAAGAIVATLGFAVAFYCVAAWLVLSALFMAVFGPETGRQIKPAEAG